MALVNTSVPTTGDSNAGWYNGRVASVPRQRVQPTLGSGFVQLAGYMPARSKLVWATLVANAAGAVVGNDVTNTANGIALVLGTAATATAPATGTALNSTSFIAFANGATTTLASTLAGRGDHWFQPGTVTATASSLSGFIGQIKNTSSTPLPVFAVPSFVTGSSYRTAYQTDNTFFKFGTGTATSTATAADFSACVYVEEFSDNGVAIV